MTDKEYHNILNILFPDVPTKYEMLDDAYRKFISVITSNFYSFNSPEEYSSFIIQKISEFYPEQEYNIVRTVKKHNELFRYVKFTKHLSEILI